MAGIKETKEVVVAIRKLAVAVLEAGKDGYGFDDISVIIGQMGSLKDAFEGVAGVPAEIKDLDRAEVKELLNEGTDMVYDILEALKKPSV